MRYLDRVAVGAGGIMMITQIPTAHPSMGLFWAGVFTALLGGIHAVDQASS